jgi:Flp pilus assembly protein TadD
MCQLSKNKAGFARIMAKTEAIKLPIQFGVLILSASGLLGCASIGDDVTSTQVQRKPAPSVLADVQSPQVQLKKQSLSADQVYRVLAAESLATKGQIGAAANVYLDLVERYGDSGLAQRAYELASQSGSRSLLELASKLNTDRNPDFIESWQVQVVLQLRAKNVPAAISAWTSFYQHSREKGVSEKEIFLSTATLAQDDMDAPTLLSFSEQLAATYPSVYAEFSHIMLLAAADSMSVAFDRIELANARYPNQPELAQLTASLAVKLANGRGVEWLGRYWQAHPEDLVVGEQLGRVYVALAQLPAAQAHFKAVLLQHPRAASVQMSLALVCLELKQADEAERLLTPLALDRRYADMARYYLGQSLYFQNKTADALTVWTQVQQGEYRLDALIWRAQVLSKQNKLAQAQALLSEFKAVDESESGRLLRARVQLYVMMRQPKDALKLLDNAIFSEQDDGALWQERANIKFELGDGAGFEQDMRQAIALSPNDADMLNALGYYLADNKKKLAEARRLIEKADSLTPDKYYINDSMGWLLFREGKLVEAEALLAKAYSLKADAEILRHWITVLLAQDNKARAQALVTKEASKFDEDVALSQFLRQMSLKP